MSDKIYNVLFIVYSRTGYLILAALLLYFFVAQFRWRGLAANFASLARRCSNSFRKAGSFAIISRASFSST